MRWRTNTSFATTLMTWKDWNLRAFFYHVSVVLAALIVWEALARAGVISANLFPPPSALVREMFQSKLFEFYKSPYDVQGSEFFLVNSALASLGRVILGIVIGFIAALITGCVISYFKLVEHILLPIVTLLAPISPIAWIPFAMVVFGIGNKPAIFVVIISVFFLMTVATVASIQNVNPSHVTWARQYGANRQQVLWYVILPSILPSLFMILRINLFAAWMSVLAAEMVGVSQGLGAMVMVGRALFNMKIILIAMILIGLCGYFLDRLLLQIQRRVFWWKKEVVLS